MFAEVIVDVVNSEVDKVYKGLPFIPDEYKTMEQEAENKLNQALGNDGNGNIISTSCDNILSMYNEEFFKTKSLASS